MKLKGPQLDTQLAGGLGVFLVSKLLLIQDRIREHDEKVCQEIRNTVGTVVGGRIIHLFLKHDLRKLLSE